ncbi:MAG: response regulator [Acidobacteriota bacterium]
MSLKLPFRLSFATRRGAVDAATVKTEAGDELALKDFAGDDVPAHGAPSDGPIQVATGPAVDLGSRAEATNPAVGVPVARAASFAVAVSAPSSADGDSRDASSTLVWLAYTSSLSARAATLEDAALAALEGRLDPAPRRRAARDTYKLATSLWLVEARDAARQAWEAAGLLDAGTLMGTANALRLSQIVESLHAALRTLPAPEALSPAGRDAAPLLLVVDDDETLGRELPIEAAVRGWRAKVIRHLSEPIDDQASVIVLGHDLVGEADAVARTRLLAAHPNAPVATLAPGPSVAERSGGHALKATRTLCKPIAPATLVDEAIDMLRRQQASPPVVLVGIADSALRRTVLDLLAGVGTIVELHTTSDALWNTAAQARPELCVLDERLAGGRALDVLRAMRRDWDIAPLSVVLITASADPATAVRAADAGVDDGVPASAVADVLGAVVRNRLDRARTQRLAADVDPATRLPRLHSAMPMIERMVSIARRYNHPLSLLVTEVDGVAALHASGDGESAERLSTLLGRRLGRAFRTEDLVTHAAPGRFVVAGFGMKSDDGVQRMAELLEGFRDQSVERAGQPAVAASFSAGIAQIKVDGPDANTLVRAAESALVTAQRQGGNRVEAATRGETSRVEWTADAIVIDADAPFAALVEHALETRGHRVRTIGDGREALELLTRSDSPIRARLIVLELGLPGLDGLSLLGLLAEAGVLKFTKAVVVTTRSVEAEMIKAMELGAIDYITKPVSLPVLMRRLRSALSGASSVG